MLPFSKLNRPSFNGPLDNLVFCMPVFMQTLKEQLLISLFINVFSKIRRVGGKCMSCVIVVRF